MTTDPQTCEHENIGGPLRVGVAGAFCRDCGTQVDCPHPPHKHLQRNPLPVDRTKSYPIECGWCGEQVG